MPHLPVCRHFLRNRCKYGLLCRFRHELTEVRAPATARINGLEASAAIRATFRNAPIMCCAITKLQGDPSLCLMAQSSQCILKLQEV